MFPYLFVLFLSWRVDDYSDYAVASSAEAVSTRAIPLKSIPPPPPQDLKFLNVDVRSAVVGLLGNGVDTRKVAGRKQRRLQLML